MENEQEFARHGLELSVSIPPNSTELDVFLIPSNPRKLESTPASTQPAQLAVERELTDEAQIERDDWNREGNNCSCHISAPCGCCTHPGNPMNQEEDETAWRPAIAQLVQPNEHIHLQDCIVPHSWVDDNDGRAVCSACGIAQLIAPSLGTINALAKLYSNSYASPHHVTFSVQGLQNLIQAAIAQPVQRTKPISEISAKGKKS